MKVFHWVGILFLALVLGGCGSESGGQQGEGVEGNHSDTSGGDAGGSGASSGAAALLALPFQPTDRLNDLTQPQTDEVCAAFSDYYLNISQEMRDFRCLAGAVEAGQAGLSPALTCNRFRSFCEMELPGLEEIPGFDFEFEPTYELSDCKWGMANRRREVCVNPTLDEFAACVLANVELELEVLDRGTLTCEEAAPQKTIRPVGYRDCACGVPVRIGPVPQDDDDWDYVSNADDACPDTAWDDKVAENGCNFYQDVDQDGVWDLRDICIGTEPDPEFLLENGCSDTQDDDLDYVPNWDDLCPDTIGVANDLGCSNAQDEDQDGIKNEVDWCPFTPGGASAVNFGCSEAQGEPWTEGIADAAPEGTALLTLGDTPEEQVSFALVPGLLKSLGDGSQYEGTMYLDFPGHGVMVLPQSNEQFTGPLQAPTSFSGTMVLPFPRLSLFEGVNIGQTGTCTVGYGPGSSPALSDLEFPFQDARQYLFGTCSTGLEVNLGPLTLSREGSVTVALDPNDPAVFLRADVEGLEPFGPIENPAVALSAQGTLKYTPTVTWGIESKLAPFDGHAWVSGSLPISTRLPAQITSFAIEGEGVVHLDPAQVGLDMGSLPDDVKFGANGEFIQTISLFGGGPMSLTLSEASLVGRLNNDERWIAMSGGVGPGGLTLPSYGLFEQRSPLVLAALLSDDPEEAFVQMEGTFRFFGSALDLPLVPDLEDVEFVGSIRVDAEGLSLEGSLSGAIHKWIPFNGAVELEAKIHWDLSEFHVSLTGNLQFKTPLKTFTAQEIYLGTDDIRLNGTSYKPW
jgi:hypothetical protein